MAEQINAPTVEVTPDNKLSDEQFAIAKKIHDQAVANGLDPEFALRIGNIENRFGTATSPAGALGPMQLMPGTAKMLKVDPNDIDQNIAGGVKHLKYLMDKYNDPYIAGMAYNAGEGVADKYLETKDTSVIPDETFNYIKMLHKDYQPADQVDTGDLPDIALPEESAAATPQEDLMTKAGAAAAGAAVGAGAGAYGETKIKDIEKAEAKAARTTEAAERKVGAAEQRVEAKKAEHTGRVKNQTAMAESASKQADKLRAVQTQAEERLAKAMDNARRYGVLEETVKTTPGGVTQEGGLGSGAMRHSNVMGEVHEANVVRKGTEAAGPGYSQKSRLIVPDKYVNAEIYTPEQKAAKAELDRAQAEVDRIYKQAGKAEAAASREAERLRNLTERGPSGMTQAEAQLEAAKSAHAEAAKFKQPGIGTRTVRAISKIPGTSILPAAGAGFDIMDAIERAKRGDITGAAISGSGAVGGGLSMLPPVTPLTAGLKALGLGLSLAAPAAQYLREENKAPQGVKFAEGGEVKKYGAGGKVVAILAGEDAAKAASKVKPTVRGRERIAFPGIYRDPRIIVGESALHIPEESPLLRELFGVTREDLDALTRDYGHDLAAPYYKPSRPPEYVGGLRSKANTQRMQDILDVASRDPRFAGSYGWYESSPLRELFAKHAPGGETDFERFTQLGAGLSPSTAVPKEIERASVAYMMDKQGRLSDFLDPRNMPKGYGHAYHTTAHNAAVKNILERGDFRPENLKMAPKTRVYYGSRTGENLDIPTADAHFVRGIGLADLRPMTKAGDFGSSISATELDPVAKWYRSDVVEPMGMRGSPAQALQWNAMGTSTGVETDLGVPFLELLSRRIGDVAAKEGVKPAKVRDEFIRGERHLARGGEVKGYAEGDYVDLGNSAKTMSGEDRVMLNRPSWSENLNTNWPVEGLKKISGAAGEGLDYLKRGLNQIRPRDEAYLIPNLEMNLGDLVPGAETLKRWSKPGEGAIVNGEPDIMGLADVGSLYGMGLTKPFTAPIKALAEKYGPAVTAKLARPYAMVESTSPELLQDTYRMRGTGKLANDPLGLALTDERARLALERSGLSKFNVKPGQGAWGGGGESEFNRGYSIKLPRGDVAKSEGALAQFGSDTDQMMMSAVKFMPQKSIEKSTALEIKNVSEKDIVNLNKKLGDEFVVQHRPQTNSVVVFNWNTPGKNMSDLQDAVTSVVPKGRVTPGTYESSVLESSQYASKGAKPKGQKTIELEQKIINRKR